MRQSRLVRKNADFSTNWLLWQRPLKNQKNLNEMNKPLHPSTNPEILVKIGALTSEIQVLEWGDWKRGSGKRGSIKNAGVEIAGETSMESRNSRSLTL